MKLCPYSVHEAIDRSYLASDFVAEKLMEHEIIHAHPELRELALEAHDKLFELYQKCGALGLKEDQGA